MIKKLAVTGANGFIGSRLIEIALDRGIEIVALVRNPSTMPQPERSGLTVLQWQLGEAAPDITGCDALFHLAGYIPQNYNAPEEAEQCFQANALGAMTLATQAADQGVAKFVYFSSGQIYSGSQAAAKENAPTYPLERATYYLASKLAGELCVQALGRSKEMKVTVLRLASVYGAGMHDRGMVPNFIRNLSQGRQVIVQDGGSYTADLVFVDDIVELALRSIETGAIGIFNAGTGQARTSLDVAGAVADAVGADRKLVVVEGVAGRHGFAALDIAKPASELAYRPKSLEEGLAAWRDSGQMKSFSK